MSPLPTTVVPTNRFLTAWVEEMVALCRPDQLHWCDGSDQEYQDLLQVALAAGDLEALNQQTLPGCYLHRSHPNDVARTEELTFICTHAQEEAGPTNNWMAPQEAYRKLGAIFRDSMRGRTLYVVPFLMGPPGWPVNKIGVQLTDSVYVALSMRIMTRMGRIAVQQLGGTNDFTRCLHGKADLDPARRFICHFPEDNTIWSVGSGYGGNALLGKKCLALRIGSYLARSQGWLAEHMLIVGLQNPAGEVTYVTAAFPSQCGKTNMAMLVPPTAYAGWKVWTVGDDICWLRVGADGRLWATNPEAGFFGVAPGTNRRSNPVALDTIGRNTLYTNVLRTPEGTVWWEGLDGPPPATGIDWQGQPWTPTCGRKGAHPNARFTTPAVQCPTISPQWQAPEGVPISAMFFGGRRAKVAPLIFETRSWQHGVYVAAAMASETTAAAVGTVGVVRRDPMAMLPFCGYNMGEYFAHWLAIGARLQHPPTIFHVNWFRTGRDGGFLWPGFGENLRVLEWAVRRCRGQAAAVETPIGWVPTPDALNLHGLAVSPDTLRELLAVDPALWRQDLADQQAFFGRFGSRLPHELWDEHATVLARLGGP